MKNSRIDHDKPGKGMFSLFVSRRKMSTISFSRLSQKDQQKNKKTVQEVLKAHDIFCHYQLKEDFVGAVINESTWLYIMWIKEGANKKKRKLGFATIEEKNKGKEWYLGVICAEHSTIQLMNHIVDDAKESGAEKLTLEAVPHVILYYSNQGFVVGNTCQENPEITSQLKKFKDRRFKNVDEAIADEKFLEFLEEVIVDSKVKKFKCAQRLSKLLQSCKKSKNKKDCKVQQFEVVKDCALRAGIPMLKCLMNDEEENEEEEEKKEAGACRRCAATSKKTGEQCKNLAACKQYGPGEKYCVVHRKLF